MIDLSALETPEAEQRYQQFVAIWETFKAESGLANDPIIQGLEEGRTIAQIKGLDRGDLEAIYAYGFSLLNKGAAQKAAIVFGHLVMIDPLEARNHYCLGVSLQMLGRHEVARDTFVVFLTLDATNPDGYLRYGECLLACGQRDLAAEAFDLALLEAERGNGDGEAIRQARHHIEMIRGGQST